MGDRAHAIKLYNNGVTALNDKDNPGHLQHAYSQFVSSVYADPAFGLGWYGLGNANSDMEMLEAAVACWQRSLECQMSNEERAKSLCNMAWRLHCLNRSEEALYAAEEAAELHPPLELSYLCLSQIMQTWGRSKKALEYAEIAMQRAPDSSECKFNRAFALLFDRQWQKGFKEFEIRFEHKLKNFLSYPYPPWRGEKNKTVFLVSEQGLGDAISFARFVRPACKRARYVHACIQPELMRLFQHCFMDIPNLNLIPMPAHFPAVDCWTTFVSLPYALGLSDDEIENAGQIEPPVYQLPKTWKVPDRKLHIGIAWRGSKLNDINKHRSIPMVEFLELCKVPGVQLYSLQIDENRNQLHELGCSGLVQDLGGYVRDVCDTVSLMQELDLIVTCESALGHIATLARKECWVAYSWQGRDYRVGLTGDKQLWSQYRIFRQDKTLLWRPVFEQIAAALRERLSNVSNERPVKKIA